MPTAGQPLRKLGFLTIGRFDGDAPRDGHLETIRTIERAEELGFDSVWLRCRHLQYGISSPVAIMAAAAMRTNRIELGTAVIPLGLENPFRLAEDLATVDLLSDGRVNPGVSVGTPMRYDDFRHALYPDTHDVEDFSKERVARLLRHLRGEPVSDFEGTVGIETYSRRVQPHSPGLADRVWYGGGLSSAIWAGEQGLNYLTSSVVTTEGSDPVDFATIQAEQIDAYRAHHPDPSRARVSQGLVVIPTDSATPDQVRRYREYADARFPRTLEPQGPRRMLFAPDLVGPSDELAERLHAHAGFQRADEVAFALPFSFTEADYAQIIEDMATRLGPALGWAPAS
ncbi:LLM class flavin-dependent oxidoreductase [Williamsia serinedens]|uniref:Flavin-dependent oxidoreductase, luciferase family (Includes alkanesulfonate monooxygenase SsuD and methylene tetrahydromethanopterin reductase) n=1 Tax=Williamsia serinedens TaxID=391736 RepID=A0ABT1GWZ5_9NOCA|nr:LLM class flavin-dependent oxidoreductase [Williamsia serinedens]MCP2159514.1 Flavin-dependent oxidoreductase, luciferase family (includes alkanesulfonate monooxygenase SsuD and methylene tetrahydromethanopterin reductase) [Williamsia serinedens]